MGIPLLIAHSYTSFKQFFRAPLGHINQNIILASGYRFVDDSKLINLLLGLPPFLHITMMIGCMPCSHIVLSHRGFHWVFTTVVLICERQSLQLHQMNCHKMAKLRTSSVMTHCMHTIIVT